MTVIDKVKSFLGKETSIAPLVVFRIAFGVMMFLSLIRFAANGWIDSLYLQPKFFFTFYGFDWIRPLDATGMYAVFALMMLCALFIATGFLYRISALLFFLLFTYVELIDKSNYLNHYYFISVMSMLMVLLPANKKFSFDNLLGIAKQVDLVPRWTIFTLQLQMAIVYFFAGVAKMNPDWLLHAMPLKIWLPSKAEILFVGFLLDEKVVAHLFSWCGMLFDISIAFFLFKRRTVWYAYAVVVVFHILTAILFPGIGMFPFIMIVCATIFLPMSFHERILRMYKRTNEQYYISNPKWNLVQYSVLSILVVHFFIQIALPFRYTFYPDKLFYNEEGYRFSWRVMLMEKAGVVYFHVKDKESGKIIEIRNSDYLTMQQEKQMSTQPDMILQFAHHLESIYSKQFSSPEVYAEAYVSVNGRVSRLLIDPKVNLAEKKDDFSHKKWILAQAD